MSLKLDPVAYIFMSSANCDKNVFCVVGMGMPATYKRNKIALNALPCGTPKFNLIFIDSRPSTYT